ncbi:MAG: hypothetical protein CMH36_01960 [Microbacterium sp.]|nr:hypothetical protein [Microbacterium sp.]
MTAKHTSAGDAPRARALLRRALRAGVAVLAAAVLLAPAAPAAADTPSPSPSASPTGTVALTLSPAQDGLFRPGESLAASIVLSNTTGAAVDGGVATLSIGSTPFTSRAELSRWLSGTADATTPAVLGATDLGTAAGGQTESASLVIDPTTSAIATLAAGVYPVRVTLGSYDARSVITVPDATTASVALVVPISAGPQSTAVIPADRLATLTATGGLLDAELTAVAGTAAVLAVDPAVVASIRVLGSSAPASARAWLQRLMTLPNERFALQYGDADVATQLEAGLSRPLAPTSLAAYLDPKNFGSTSPSPTTTGGPTPTPSASGSTTSTLPTLSELLAIGPSDPSIYWAPSGLSDAQTVSELRSSDAAAVSLVSSVSTTTGANNATVSASGTVDAAPVVVYDGEISSALGLAAATGDANLRGAPLAAASAALFFAAHDASGSPLAVVVDRTATRSAAGVGAAVAAVTGGSGISLTSLSGLISTSGTPRALATSTIDAARTSAVTSLQSQAASIAQFATVLSSPALLTGPEDAAALQLLGGSWLSDLDGWKAALSDHAAATATTLGSVDITPTSNVNLFASGANLWFAVRNDLPYPVDVTLYATPNDVRLDVDARVEVHAEASSVTRVEVPVRARLGNGDVRIALQLRSASGVAVGTAQTVDVAVRADWENIGLVVISVLVAAFIGLGVIRMVRRRRRLSRPTATTAGDDATDATDAAADPATGDPATTDAAAPADPKDAP